MNWVGYRVFSYLLIFCMAITIGSLGACSNSVLDAEVDEQTDAVPIRADESSSPKTTISKSSSSSSKEKSSSSKEGYLSSFKPDDKEYPYAGIPRIVIETEYRQAIKDRETEIPAKLQIWGEKKSESEIMNLMIRGRGNSSWDVMPKKSYKIEFENKQSMLGMPKDKDWTLIANYADKTLMRNYLAYRLSAALDVFYAPRSDYAELYVNGNYLGVYLVTETIKKDKDRVNIPKDDDSYIVEFDQKYKADEQVVFSDIISKNGKGKPFRIHDPKNASESVLDAVKTHIEDFETFLLSIKAQEDNGVDDWIDVDESVKHYWVQELLKNPDSGFYTSVYFSWIVGEKIKMGPVWDFDLAMGNSTSESVNTIDNLVVRTCYWNKFLFKDSLYSQRTSDFWNQKYEFFLSLLDSIDVYKEKLASPARNNFKRWNILEKTSDPWHPKPFKTYDEAVEWIKDWLMRRIEWIDQNK